MKERQTFRKLLNGALFRIFLVQEDTSLIPILLSAFMLAYFARSRYKALYNTRCI